MEEDIGAHLQEVVTAVKRIFLQVYWCEISVMIAGLKIYEVLLGGLVLSKTFTCQEITTLGILVALGLSNLWIRLMLLMLNMKWMVISSLDGS